MTRVAMRIVSTIFILLLAVAAGAQDKLHSSFSKLRFSSSSNAGALPGGYQLIHYNAVAPGAAFSNNALSQQEVNYLGINKNNFLYAIETIDMNNHTVVSYNTAANYAKAIAITNVNWDGNTNKDARVQGMAIDNNNSAWVVGCSVIDGNNYATRFGTTATGGITNFENKAFILKTDLPSVEVKDLAFDLFNNMYALVRDIINGHHYICFAHEKTIAAAAAGSTITLSRKWQLMDGTNSVKFDPKYQSSLPDNFADFDSYMADGLAFDSEGSLLVSVDKMSFTRFGNTIAGKVTNQLYRLKIADGASAPVIDKITLYTSAANINTFSYCDDLAGNYYPAFLPLSYTDVNATLSNNHLQVNWGTATERNAVKFDITISKDGTNFNSIGSSSTKATNGNSNENLYYTFDHALSTASWAACIPALLLAGLTFVNRKKKYSFLLTAIFCIAMAWSCSKKDTNNTVYDGKIFVKINYIDNKGKSTSSKIVQALKL